MPHSYALGSLSRLILKLNLAFYWDFVAPKIPALTRKQEMKEKCFSNGLEHHEAFSIKHGQKLHYQILKTVYLYSLITFDAPPCNTDFS